MKLKLGLLALLCPVFWASGQQTNKNQSKPLQEGETVPPVTVSVISGNNSQSRDLYLPDDSDQLLLIDFWSTTCGSCIKSLPELSVLQNKFNPQLRIVLAAYDKKERILSFFHNRKDTAGKGLLVVYQDTLLKQLFVHQYIPHIAWIYKGVFIGATGAEMVNERTIAQVLRGEGLETTLKKDLVAFNYDQPLFPIAANTSLGQVIPLWTSVFSGYIPGLPLKAGHSNDTLTRGRRIYLINHPVLQLYAIALSSPLPLLANRRVLPADGDYVYDRAKGYYRDWAPAHCFSYELTYPDTVSETAAYSQMKDDLDRFLALSGSIVYRQVHCLVLKNAPAGKLNVPPQLVKMIRENDRDGGSAKQIAVADLVYLLNRQKAFPPVIDESGTPRIIKPDMKQSPQSVEDWQTLLARSGLILEDQQRVLPMFVLRSNN